MFLSRYKLGVGKGWLIFACHIPLLSWHGWHPTCTYRDPRNSLAYRRVVEGWDIPQQRLSLFRPYLVTNVSLHSATLNHGYGRAGSIPWYGWHPTYRDPRNSLADVGRGPVLGRDGSLSLVTSPIILTRVTPYLQRSSQFIGVSQGCGRMGHPSTTLVLIPSLSWHK